MANKIKFTQSTIDYIISQVAIGRSIKKILEDEQVNASWEGWRKLLHKKPAVKKEYELAQQDGIDYLLSSCTDQLQSTINEFKINGKGDLAISHLIKEIVGLTKWKASHLITKYSNKTNVSLSNHNDKPLVVKWQK